MTSLYPSLCGGFVSTQRKSKLNFQSRLSMHANRSTSGVTNPLALVSRVPWGSMVKKKNKK